VADETSQAILVPRPLISADAAALTADIIPRTFWEATFVLQRDFSLGIQSAGTLSADNDVWTILLSPPSAMPNYVFYPIAMRAVLKGDKASIFALSLLWQDEACFSVDMRGDTQYAFDSVDLSAHRSTDDFVLQQINPDFHAYPPEPGVARETTIADNALAGFALQIGTFNTTAMDTTRLHIDCRFLAFPEAVTRSAGFYLPRQYFKGQ